MQDREYGALGLAKIRTGSIDTPETIAAAEELKASWGGCCPPWGHTYYPAGNMLTFQGDDEGIEQLLKDSWPDAWLAIQPVLAQVNELTSGAWYGRTEVCCGCSNTMINLRGGNSWRTGVHQLLTASSWIIKLNEVLNPHGLAADLHEKSTYRICEGMDGDGNSTGLYAETDIDLYLRLFLWSARAVQSAPQPILPQPMEVPPGAAGGYWITVVGPDGAAVPDDRAARADAGPILRVPCAGTRCNGATDPDDAAGGTIGRCAWADDRRTVTRREAVH